MERGKLSLCTVMVRKSEDFHDIHAPNSPGDDCKSLSCLLAKAQPFFSIVHSVSRQLKTCLPNSISPRSLHAPHIKCFHHDKMFRFFVAIRRYKNLNNTVATRAKNLHVAVHSISSFDKSLDQVSRDGKSTLVKIPDEFFLGVTSHSYI